MNPSEKVEKPAVEISALSPPANQHQLRSFMIACWIISNISYGSELRLAINAFLVWYDYRPPDSYQIGFLTITDLADAAPGLSFTW